MATDIRIKLALEGASQVQSGLQKTAQSADQAGRSFEGLASAGTSLRGLSGIVSAGLIAREFIQAADAVTVLRNQLQLATGSVGAAAAAYDSLYRIAQNSRTSFTGLGSTFASISRSTEGLGISQARLLTVTEAIGNAMTISGGSAESMNAALIQLGQGFASGTLRGEELNSVMEQTPRLARAIADGLGVTIGKLREMGKEGQLSAETVLKALESQASKLAGEVQNSVVTVGQAWTQLTNATTKAVGELDRATGVTSTLSGVMQYLSGTIDNVSDRFVRAREDGRGFIGALAQAQIMAAAEALGHVDERAANIGKRLNDAEKELSTLQLRFNAQGGFYLASEIEKTRQLVEELKRAKQAQEDLKAQRGTSQSQQFGEASGSIGAIAAKGLEEARQAQELLAAVRNKALGVDKAYTDQIQKLHGYLRDGKLTQAEYTEAVQKLTAATFKQQGSSKAQKDGLRELEQEMVKQQSIMNAVLGVNDDYVETLERLQVMRKDGTLTEADYIKQIELLISKQPSTIAYEKERTEQTKKLNDALIGASRAQGSYISELSKAADAAEAEALAERDNVETFGMSRRAIADRNAARLEETATMLEAIAIKRLDRDEDQQGYDLAIRQAAAIRDRAASIRKGAAQEDAKDAVDAAKRAGEEALQAWNQTADEISGLITNALRIGGKEGWDSIRDYIAANALQAIVKLGVNEIGSWLGIAGAAASGTSGTSGAGGLSILSSASSLYAGAGKLYTAAANYFTGASAAGRAASAGTAYELVGYGGYTGGAIGSGATAGSAAAAGGSSAAAAIPIIGWIVAAIAASQAAYKGGNTIDMIGDSNRSLGIGAFEASKYRNLSALGISDEWAQILSGAPLTARLLGHKPSVSGFGVGTVEGGNFVQSTQTPLSFGDNTLGGGVDTDLQSLSSSIAANVILAAGKFGGGLQSGLTVGSFTDRDRQGEVSALLGFLQDGKLTAGVQTGSGAFGAGGPGVAGAKLQGDELKDWIGEQMPVLIVQGLQQSDLTERFETYFDSVAGSALTSESATAMLNTAGAVQQLTDAVTPLGGVFSQFADVSVAALARFADASTDGVTRFDQLGQSISGYYDAYYSQAEKTEIATAGITKALAALGLQMPDLTQGAEVAKTQFRALVDAQKLNTEEGQAAFQTLIGLSGQFNALVTAGDQAAAAIGNLTNQLQDAIDRVLPKFQTPGQQTQTSYQGIAGSLNQAGVTLGGLPIDVSTLIGASKDDILEFATTFISLSTNSDAAKLAVVNAADALAGLKDQAASLADSVQSGLDSVIGDFSDILGPAGLANYNADRVQSILAEGGINVSRDQILGSTKDDIAALFTSVGVEAQAAILKAYPFWKEIQDAFATPTGPGAAIAAYRTGPLADSIEAATLNTLSPADRIARLKGREATLRGEIATGDDPVAAAQELQTIMLQRLEEEKDLRNEITQSTKESILAQIDAQQRIVRFAQDAAAFVGTARFSDLSPLSARDQVSAAQSLYETTLAAAKGGDANAQGNVIGYAQAYLQEASSAFASGPAYAAIFQRVTGDLEAVGLTGASAANQLTILQAQAASLGTIETNSGDIVTALESIDAALAARQGSTIPGTIGDIVTGGGTAVDGILTSEQPPAASQTPPDLAGLLTSSPVSTALAAQAVEAVKQTEFQRQMASRLGEVNTRLGKLETLDSMLNLDREAALQVTAELRRISSSMKVIETKLTTGAVPA